MFESLSASIEKALKTLKGQGRITDINVAQTVKEIRKALLDADVNYNVAKQVTDRIKEVALGREILISVSPGQMLIKICHEELTNLMGGQKQDIKIQGDPAVILIAGLQGSGKTTFTGKLSNYLKKQGRSVLVVACDVYRPAAVDQLTVLAEQVGVDIYKEPGNNNPIEIAKNALKFAKDNHKKIVIVDTAGRLAVDEAMMNEVSELKKLLQPTETLFVVDSMTGQDAVNTAKAFNERLNFDGVVLTKLDGDTRGGAALSIRSVVDKPIKFVSNGEKMDALDVFYPDRMAQRILGMGDVLTLVEKAQQAFDEEETRKLNAKFRKNEFDFNDFLSQIENIKKMGNLKDLVGMIPGVRKMMGNADIDENAFRPVEAIIRSMTPKERANPDLINSSRKQRIAAGSGRTIQEVNNLLKQHAEMKKMMKLMNKHQGRLPNMPKMR